MVRNSADVTHDLIMMEKQSQPHPFPSDNREKTGNCLFPLYINIHAGTEASKA